MVGGVQAAWRTLGASSAGTPWCMLPATAAARCHHGRNTASPGWTRRLSYDQSSSQGACHRRGFRSDGHGRSCPVGVVHGHARAAGSRHSCNWCPRLPADGKYAAGTVVTVTPRRTAGYALDSTWYSVPGRFGQMYHEGMTREFKVTIDRDKRIGASFIEESAVSHINVTHDVVYAKPGVKPLKYDVFSPKGREEPARHRHHPWRRLGRERREHHARPGPGTHQGRPVRGRLSIDYRWAGKADGDATGNTMANLIEDVFGGIAHIMEHAKQYGGDPTRIGVTGDSAGGHLSAAASLLTEQIGSRGFGKTPGVFEFMPSYLPKNKTVEQVRTEMLGGHQGGGAELRRVQRSPAQSLLRRSRRRRLLERRHRAAQPHSQGNGTRRAAVPGARHAAIVSIAMRMHRSSSTPWSRRGNARSTSRSAARVTRSSTGNRRAARRRPSPITASTTRRR